MNAAENERAFGLFLRSAGDELTAFMGEPPRPRVSDEALQTAARALCEDVGDAQAFAEAPEAIVAELRAQAFEEVWTGFLSPLLRAPAKRAEIIAFIERRTGRPLPHGSRQ